MASGWKRTETAPDGGPGGGVRWLYRAAAPRELAARLVARPYQRRAYWWVARDGGPARLGVGKYPLQAEWVEGAPSIPAPW